MYAVIKTGGKQYKVIVGSVVKVEKLHGEEGNKITFDEVLMVGNDKKIEIGNPTLTNRTVEGTVVAQARHKKVGIMKMRRRKHYMKRGGHRQNFTEVKIDTIS